MPSSLAPTFCTRMVWKPSSKLSMERLAGGWRKPDMAARAEARAASAPIESMSVLAAGLKNLRRSGCTPLRLFTAWSAEAFITSVGGGGDTSSKFADVSRAMLRRVKRSRGPYIAMAMPVLLARPVRPERWRKVSESLGISKCTTRSTLGMSRPRAATSVATSTLKLPSRNFLRVFSRVICAISPWSASQGMVRASATATSSAARLVCVNTIALAPLPYTVIKSTSTGTRLSGGTLHERVRMVSAILPVFSSPTRSMFTGSLR
mmetsp:Transcript_45460/g.144608  ORF Transcript_45460/g.144608 Transcript_45460/m.144608 type:complete len:263 (-) Transcript_45460:388-1176(-)